MPVDPLSRAASRHRCPAMGCPYNLPFDKFACQAHWFSLPPDLRAQISSTWRSGDLPAYMEARAEAVLLLGGIPDAG